MDKSLTLYCEKSRAVVSSKEPRSHKMGKRIEHAYHLIQEIMRRGDAYCSHEDNIEEKLC